MSEQLASVPVVDQDIEKIYPDLDGAEMSDLDLMKVYKQGFGPDLTREEQVEHAKRVEAGEFARFLRDHPEEQGPNKIEADELEWLISDGDEAYDELVASCLAYVLSIAKGYQSRGVPLLDIVQEGNKGLMHAVEKFDYKKGYMLSTYATDWIKRDIRRGMAENSRNIRLPREKYEAINGLNRVRGKFFPEHGREATPDELVIETGMALHVIEDLLDIAPDTQYLDKPVDVDESLTVGDMVMDDQSDLVITSAIQTEIRETVERLLGELSPTQNKVIRLAFGLTGREYSGPQIGAEFGRTGQWARETRDKALNSMRKLASPALRELLN